MDAASDGAVLHPRSAKYRVVNRGSGRNLMASSGPSDLQKFTTEPQATNVPWIDSPFFPRLLGRAGLDPEMAGIVERFARDGYVIIDPEIPADVIETVVEQISDKFQQTYHPYYADTRRLQDGWAVFPAIKEIATAARVLEILSALYGRDPIPFQTLNFRVGSEQKTHSDTIHFHCVPNLFMAGVWVALEDIDLRNGPLHYYPQSHKLPVYSMSDLGVMASSPDNLYEHYWMYENFAEALMRSTELERAEMQVERGQALIWSANLFHGGSPILDPGRTRLSQVTHYFFSDCLYYTPLLSDMALGKTSLRKIVDLRSGEIVKHSYNGKMIESLDEWPPRLAGCELALTPQRLHEFEEMAARHAPILQQSSAAAPDTPSLRRRMRELIERTLGR
jgi:ectoine hydroxylase-related dioxygenase (phytanoyl-CoA dioxygenase family)